MRKIYLLQYFVMMVVRHYKLCIAAYRAVNKLIVVRVRRNQIETE